MLTTSRKALYGLCVVILLSTAGTAYYQHYNSTDSKTARYRDQSHDRVLISQTNKSLDTGASQAYKLLKPELAHFGFTLPKPTPAICKEGDPSLYKYACANYDEFNKDHRMSTTFDAVNTASALEMLDSDMTSAGWKQEDGDFRVNPLLPPAKWEDTIRDYPVNISYRKGDCYLNVVLILNYQSSSGNTNTLICAADLLLGTYN